MSITSALALFSAMLLLAIIPGPGVVAVVARSMTSGFSHGAVTALGIVMGDYVFILLCLSGLSIIAETMGGVFTAIKYLGAAYLIWLGIKLIGSPSGVGKIEGVRETSYLSNLLIGLLTTLGNPKAILFYVSFFPTFLDMAALSIPEIFAILLVTTLSVGGVMLGYAYLAARASTLLSKSTSSRSVNLIGGGVLIGGGAVLAARA
ncbi:LysE family translocator [Microbulbifer rhizosphaerae]|uniref:Threonine/homoserine/homoserine lactone efflux protein n=1 Tax=Microbulbifer rhizosphaerae TaxID=1562603 RepID=A0A7W4WB51_9GAMM|nr:LysE family translocator [Microbulbifer rhizosphaerae]MBB3061037.1 threonine/homoserine/homoserine lactone efflux protein [Microbulbifer rhizosphaerae]